MALRPSLCDMISQTFNFNAVYSITSYTILSTPMTVQRVTQLIEHRLLGLNLGLCGGERQSRLMYMV